MRPQHVKPPHIQTLSERNGEISSSVSAHVYSSLGLTIEVRCTKYGAQKVVSHRSSYVARSEYSSNGCQRGVQEAKSAVAYLAPGYLREVFQ